MFVSSLQIKHRRVSIISDRTNCYRRGKDHVQSFSTMKCHQLLFSLLFSILSSKIHLIDGFSAHPSPLQRALPPRPEFHLSGGQVKCRKLCNPDYSVDTSTQLGLAIQPSTIVASLALVGSSAAGMQLDRWLPSSGILGTLMTAALLSNILPLVPLVHPLYDLCWSWILPGSLALLLLGYRSGDSTSDVSKAAVSIQTSQRQIMIRAIGRVAGPFLLASMGSILGCWTSYQFAVMGRWFSTTAQARAATSCLAASYVGGSVNLFATAKIIQAPASLLSSMATADLIAMALYFSVLSSAMEWKWLKSLFFQDEASKNTKSQDAGEYNKDSEFLEETNTTVTVSPSLWSSGKTNTLSTIPILLALTWAIVAVANRIESYVGRWIPGTACGVIAVVAPLLRSIVFRIEWIKDRSEEWSLTASTLADWFFFLFFAAIGVGVDLRATLQMGPACLLVSVLALSVHLVVTVIGSHLCLPTKRWGVTLEDLWIASNAAIGGPATAAAFCNRMKGGNPLALWGRTVAATGT
jgi:uncharacterized membrane protein